MKRQTKAPTAKAIVARWTDLRSRKLSGSVPAGTSCVPVGDSETRFGVVANAILGVITGSGFVRIGSALTIVDGSTVLPGNAFVLEFE